MPSQGNYTMTLRQVYDALAVLDCVLPQKRTELRSAIKRFWEVTNVNPSSPPADGPTIRAAIKSASWQLAGLSKDSWANMTSRVAKALEVVGVNMRIPTQSGQ